MPDRAGVRAERLRQQLRIVGGIDGAAAEILQRGEEVELVGRGTDHHWHPGRATFGGAGHGIDGQGLRPGNRTAQLLGADAAVVQGPLQLVRRQRAKALGRSGGIAAPGLGRILQTRPLGGRQVVLRLTRPTLDDRRTEQPLRAGGDEMVADRHGPRRLTRDGHLARIAPEPGDVVVHPTQRRLLVCQAVVADVAGRAQSRVRQEAQRAQPIVDGDDDDVAAARQSRAL